MNMPSTYAELKQKSSAELCAIWEHFFKSPVIAPASNLLRPLWYKIQCERDKAQRLAQKYITRLNAYALDPDACIERAHKTKYNLKSGTQIVKAFKGKEHLVHVDTPEQFSYGGKAYKSLSAIATEICGHKVSGYDFFGLANKSGGAVSMSKSVA
jgi:hypothetical protein